MSSPPIYLDHNATTPLDPRVFEEMKPYFLEKFGNASSVNHSFGWEADLALKKSREQIADCISAKPKEIIFTSGATESINLALLGVFTQLPQGEAELITSRVEHTATLAVAKEIEKRGYTVHYLDVDSDGIIQLEQLDQYINEKTALISLLHANNEVGSINPIQEVAIRIKDQKILLHIDASQSLANLKIDVDQLGIHLLSLSAHKAYGPKGIGALYVRSKSPRVRLKPSLFGAGHESGLRPGTANIPSCVGFGKACEIMNLELDKEVSHKTQLRDKLLKMLEHQVPDLKINGHPEKRLASNLNLSFPNILPSVFWSSLQGLAVSSGSACATNSTKASHVLSALGLNSELSRSTVRFGIGRFNTEEEVTKAAEIIITAYKKARKV